MGIFISGQTPPAGSAVRHEEDGGCNTKQTHTMFELSSVCVCFQAVEEQEELELRCTQLKGDARVYRQRNKQTLRQLEEVIWERDKVRSKG